jgi:peptide/nickel transport system permease protein
MTGSLARALRAALQSPGGRAGALLLAAFALFAVIGPWFLPDPTAIPSTMAGPAAPGGQHLFGTDQLGRDILARTVSGARISLGVGVVAVALAMTLGTLVGLIAGYAGGIADALLMRTVDAALAIPRLFILLLLVLVWDRIPLPVLVAVIGATGWFATSRLVRGEVLRLRQEPFVLAAVALGASPGRIIARHLLPNVAGPVIVAATLGLGDVILLEAGLSFLGLGVQPPTPSWGGMILDARPILSTAPWAALFPGLAIMITVLAANLIGEALQSALDPRTA